MNTPLLNRDFKLPEDDWYQITPRGECPHPSGVTQVLDETAIAAMVDRFKEERANPNFGGLLVDFDHFSYDPEKSSEAAGWITEMESREDGLWGRIRWTPQGRRAVGGGEFRFISPVWLPGDMRKIEGSRMRPVRLDTAGVTNQPNIKGMAPLSNRQLQREETQKQKMENIIKTLGLAAGTAEEAVIQAVEALTNRAAKAEKDLAGLVTFQNRVAELEGLNKTLEGENKTLQSKLTNTQAEADLDRFANRFKPEARESWKAIVLSNREAGIKLLESLPLPQTQSASSGQAILNRDAGKTPATGDLKSEIAALVVSEKMTRGQALDAIRNRKPDLYKAWVDGGCGQL